ncbi:hypothetical protein ANN_26087 [Periplaneta americana]|uniref:Uncharacterized protein n=1 Tax=Periplaneta americana TaxID=6978 RepID=A0ABQ8S4Z1_PERAM|nr:hypothetical protein ANN_26087 [Periplaneta americana]
MSEDDDEGEGKTRCRHVTYSCRMAPREPSGLTSHPTDESLSTLTYAFLSYALQRDFGFNTGILVHNLVIRSCASPSLLVPRVQHRKLPSIYWVERKPRKKSQPGNLPRPGFEPGPPGFAARRADRYSTGDCGSSTGALAFHPGDSSSISGQVVTELVVEKSDSVEGFSRSSPVYPAIILPTLSIYPLFLPSSASSKTTRMQWDPYTSHHYNKVNMTSLEFTPRSSNRTLQYSSNYPIIHSTSLQYSLIYFTPFAVAEWSDFQPVTPAVRVRVSVRPWIFHTILLTPAGDPRPGLETSDCGSSTGALAFHPGDSGSISGQVVTELVVEKSDSVEGFSRSSPVYLNYFTNTLHLPLFLPSSAIVKTSDVKYWEGGPIAWPARSPDLTPLDSWGSMKEKVYQTEITSREELVAKINTAEMEIHQHELGNVQREVRRRAEGNFGIVKRKLRKTDRVYVPDQYNTLIHQANTNNRFSVESVTTDDILNFKYWWQEYYKKTTCSLDTLRKKGKDKNMFSSAQFSEFVYSKDNPGCVTASLFISSEMRKHRFYMKKTGSGRIVMPTQKHTMGKFPLIRKKLGDVSKVRQYIPLEYTFLYEEILNWPPCDNLQMTWFPTSNNTLYNN